MRGEGERVAPTRECLPPRAAGGVASWFQKCRPPSSRELTAAFREFFVLKPKVGGLEAARCLRDSGGSGKFREVEQREKSRQRLRS